MAILLLNYLFSMGSTIALHAVARVRAFFLPLNAIPLKKIKVLANPSS